jgi:hypothetical protein
MRQSAQGSWGCHVLPSMCEFSYESQLPVFCLLCVSVDVVAPVFLFSTARLGDGVVLSALIGGRNLRQSRRKFMVLHLISWLTTLIVLEKFTTKRV